MKCSYLKSPLLFGGLILSLSSMAALTKNEQLPVIPVSKIDKHLCQNAHKIYNNARFITLNPKQPTAEAVAVINHRLVAVGKTSELMKVCRGPETKIIDLNKAFVTPGFINTGSQFALYGWLANHAIDLSASNSLGQQGWQPVKSTEEFLSALNKHNTGNSEWLIIYGYDKTKIKGQPLTQEMLDNISRTRPVMVINASGQEALLNKVAVQKIGKLNEKLPTTSLGVIKEKDFQALLTSLINPKELQKSLQKAAQDFAAQGYTTVSEMQLNPGWLNTYEQQSRPIQFPVDLIINLSMQEEKKRLDLTDKDYPKLYAGYLIVNMDGLVRQYSAFLNVPYFQEANGYGIGWRGSLEQSPTSIEYTVMAAAKAGIPLAFIASGDAAIDFALNLTQKAQIRYGKENFQPRLFNAVVVRDDQLHRMKLLDVNASWFSPHLHYWGEVMCHEFLGPERAHRDSPLEDAKNILGTLSIYSKVPSTPISALNMMQQAQSRQVQPWHYPPNKRCPRVFAADQKINAKEALEAITKGAAAFYGLEKDKGSIETGKLADMTLLNASPLEAASEKELNILGTISRGVLHLKPAKTEKNP